MNVTKTNDLFNEIIDTKDNYNPTKYPKISGWNFVTSARAGGKTTNCFLWAIAAYAIDNTRFMYVRTNHAMTVRTKMNMIFNDINYNILDNNGKNYIERLTHGKYKYILYCYTLKTFVLSNNDKVKTKDLTNCETIGYVASIDKQEDIKSTFVDSKCDLMIIDEIVDNYVNNKSCINMINLISTVFRLRENQIALCLCNMSAGNIILLRQFEIYERILKQKIPFSFYTTTRDMKISVELFDVIEKKSHEQISMNQRFYGLQVDGIDNVRGYSVCNEIFRELPENCNIIKTYIKLYLNNEFYEIYTTSSNVWQTMIYVKQCNDDLENYVVFTDDRQYSYKTPNTYYNFGLWNESMNDFYKMYCRDDICYSNNNTFISVSSWFRDIGKRLI